MLSSSSTLDGMMKTIMQQFSETRKLIETMRSEVGEKIDAVKAELKSDIQSVKDECAAKFQSNEAAMEVLNKRVDSVHQKIGALENRNELIISGIPFQNGENLNATIKIIGKQLAVREATTQMAEARRMMNRNQKDGDSLIVVEFPLRSTRDEFYSAYLRKRDLKLRHLGLDSDRRVYINESLHIDARKVKSAALRLKKAGKLAMVYTKQGIVYVKCAADGPSTEIYSEDELKKYL